MYQVVEHLISYKSVEIVSDGVVPLLSWSWLLMSCCHHLHKQVFVGCSGLIDGGVVCGGVT